MDEEFRPPTTDELLENSAEFQESIFCLGMDYQDLRPEMRALDQQKSLGLGSVLYPTPAWWVMVPTYRVSKRMVTNNEYRRFLMAPDHDMEEGDEENGVDRFIERPDLWEMVWEQAKIQNLFYTTWVGDDRPLHWNEDYSDCDNAIQALLKSFMYEMFRKAHLPFPAPGERNLEEEAEHIRWIYYAARYLYRHFYLEEEQAAIEAAVFDVVSRNDFREELLNRSAALQDRILKLSKQTCDPKFRETMQHRPNEVEAVLFLHRLRKVTQTASLDGHLNVGDIFYPRSWDTPLGDGFSPGATKARLAGGSKSGRLRGGLHKAPLSGQTLRGRQVPWGVRPVMGVSLYESLAYTVWLTQFTYQDGYLIKLPSEAEYERCASWPLEGWEPQGELEMRPEFKALFPWEPPYDETDDPGILKDVVDFSTYFGDQARSLDGFYYQDQQALARLLQKTARFVPGRDDRPDTSIEMLLGFGWQWTEDRYQDSEDMYNRFEGDDSSKRTDIRAFRNGTRTQVYEYFAPGFHPDWSHFVARGCPEIVGGPGTATRRFALMPLRGYLQVGFRWAMRAFSDDL